MVVSGMMVVPVGSVVGAAVDGTVVIAVVGTVVAGIGSCFLPPHADRAKTMVKINAAFFCCIDHG